MSEIGSTEQTCSCPCGQTSFQITAAPSTRFFCHCTICQKLYKKAFADVTLLAWEYVNLADENAIRFDKYRSFPAINRGTCRACNAPVMAYAGSGASRLAFIAADNYENKNVLPDPQLHIFYDTCAEAVDDELPKHKGYIRSQLAVMKLMRKQPA